MKNGRGRPKKKREAEGEKQTMKSLTKNHAKFMNDRPKGRSNKKNNNENAKEDLEALLLVLRGYTPI
jgi:hypothetical protein